MIENETEIKLKNNGFPFVEIPSNLIKNCHYCNNPFFNRDGLVYIRPKMEHIISLCNNKLKKLENTQDGWVAYSDDGKRTEPSFYPEDAVAKFWLMLQK